MKIKGILITGFMSIAVAVIVYNILVLMGASEYAQGHCTGFSSMFVFYIYALNNQN